MEWQAVVLVMQILMLVVGWFLFQQAKGELSARAAETPVLGEVKALQRAIKQMLADLDQTSELASQQLESRCRQAQDLSATLAGQLVELEATQHRLLSLCPDDTQIILPPLSLVTEPNLSMQQDTSCFSQENNPVDANKAVAVCTESIVSASTREKRRARIFALHDAGQSRGSIARETGISEGEIETLLGLRQQRA